MSMRNSQSGFTLVEMAVVLVIVGLLLGGLLIPVTAQMEMRGYSQTNARLAEIKEALIGYAIINGRLPCPATAASNGLESFCPAGTPTGACVGAETTVVQTHGNCSAQGTNVFSGFLPAATLGIAPQDAAGFAVDAWGGNAINRIRYAVSSITVAGTAHPFTTATVPTLTTPGMKTVAASGMGSFSTQFLYVCGTKTTATAAPLANCVTAAGAVQLADNAVFVIYSVGKNAATGGTSTDEAVNPNPNSPNTNNDDVVFVSHEPTPTYDDTLVWTSVSELVNKMVNAGQLP